MARYSLFVLKVPLNTNQPLMVLTGIVLRRYRWAFVGDPGNVSVELDKRRQLRDLAPTFVPHVLRIARRLSARVCYTVCR